MSTSTTTRRRYLAAGVGTAIASLAGCVDELDQLLGDDLLFEASVATVPDAVLAETGYAEHAVADLTVEETFAIGDETRTVRLQNWHAEYDRAIAVDDLHGVETVAYHHDDEEEDSHHDDEEEDSHHDDEEEDSHYDGEEVDHHEDEENDHHDDEEDDHHDGETLDAAVFMVVSTPRVEVLGQTLNPLDELDPVDIVDLIDDHYDDFGALHHVGDTHATVAGVETTVATFEAEAEFVGEDVTIDLRLHISRAVASGDDFLLTIGGYPRDLGAIEEHHYLDMAAAIEHAG